MDPHPAEQLTVKVDLMTTPCLWYWEIVDTRDGTLVESSWATEWTAYESSHEAWQAGILRVTDLARRGRGRRVGSADHLPNSTAGSQVATGGNSITTASISRPNTTKGATAR